MNKPRPESWSQEVWDKVHSETIKNLQYTISKIDKDIRKYIDKCKTEWEIDCKRELDPRVYLDCVHVFIPYDNGTIYHQKKVLGHYKIVNNVFYGILGDNYDQDLSHWTVYPK